MCAAHTLPYLSRKIVKITFPLEYLLKFRCTNYINNVWVLIMVCYSSCQPFPSIYNLTICLRIIFTRCEARNYILFEWCVRLLLNDLILLNSLEIFMSSATELFGMSEL